MPKYGGDNTNKSGFRFASASLLSWSWSDHKGTNDSKNRLNFEESLQRTGGNSKENRSMPMFS